jgi:hypothetical protein
MLSIIDNDPRRLIPFPLRKFINKFRFYSQKKLNIYTKLRFKLFKLCNYEISPSKFAAPSSPIALYLRFFIIYILVEEEIFFNFIEFNYLKSVNHNFYEKSRFKLVKFFNYNISTPIMDAPSKPISF